MGEKRDTLTNIITDWWVWFGEPVTVGCKECGQSFTGPERANSVLCKICPSCWQCNQT